MIDLKSRLHNRAFQGSGRADASPKVLVGHGHPGDAACDQKRRIAVRRDRHDHNRHHLLALRAHPGAFIPRALPAHEDAPDDVCRDGVRGFPMRA